MSVVLLDTREADRQAWLEARRKGIGSSDAAAICGLNPYKSPIQVYMEKTGQLPEEDQNERMYWGTVLEPVLAQEFTRRTGFKTQRRNAILRHPDYEWMLANLDRIIVGTQDGPGVLELKTTAAWNAGQWRGEKIPYQYEIQVHHQLAVTGYSYGYIAVLIGGQEFRYQRIDRDEETIQYLIEIERRFWEEHVLKQAPPDFDGSEASSEFLQHLYPEATNPEEISLPPKAQGFISDYVLAKREEERWAQRRQEAENNLKALLGEHEAGRIGKYRITWQTVRSSRLDTQSLRNDQPDIYAKYAREITSRRFAVREV